jgi:7-carboxy-7-deazaguanine synthase
MVPRRAVRGRFSHNSFALPGPRAGTELFRWARVSERMRIIEVFHSVQGEGPLTGVRTTFVRTARCNLRCAWCDTTYSFGPGRERTIPSLLREVARHRTRYVCLTGGEPLLQRESPELVRRLSGRGIQTVIETGGSLDVSPYLDLPGVCLSVDVKCPSSKMQGRNRWANLPLLRASDVLKFVIGDRADYRYARRVLERYRGPATVVFQPVWGTDAGRLADWVLEDRLDVRVMLQEHKVLWGDVPGR